jgi:ABC-type transport system substrate-binding protein
MRKGKRIIFLIVSIICSVALNGCALLKNEAGKMKESFRGREAIIQTYDEESNIIDRVEGKSISVSTEDKFTIIDKEGKTTSQSSVINLTIGGKSMVHVGSSLILYEKGLTDVFNEYAKKVDINSLDRSTPFVNRMVNDMKNITSGNSRIILIRSQSGKPLATFAGNKVSYFATGIDKTTGILIDGKYLFIYRCDYTIYDSELLN